MAHQDPNTLQEAVQEVAPSAIAGGAVSAFIFEGGYVLDQLARTPSYDPDPHWQAVIPWYTKVTEHGGTALQAWVGQVAHIGEVALYALPIGGLCGIGYKLSSWSIEESRDGYRARALALAAGSLACYAAAGAWTGGVGVLRSTPDNSYAASHKIGVTLVFAVTFGTIGGFVDGVRQGVASLRDMPNWQHRN